MKTRQIKKVKTSDKLTSEDKKRIEELSEHPKIYDLIKNSIVPSIHGYDIIKEALALQLFGGITKEVKNATSISGEINLLIIGDPGMGKTHLLKGKSKLVLRGVYLDCNKGEFIGNQNLDEEYNLQNLGANLSSLEGSLICIDELVIKSDELISLKEILGKKTVFNTR